MEGLTLIRNARELAGQMDLEFAWRKVAQKDGMPGVDGVSVRMFAGRLQCALPALARSVVDGRYRPLPFRLLAIHKAGGARVCMVPALADRVLQSAAARLLEGAFERYFENSSFAYRPGRGVALALRRIRELQQAGFRYFLRTDVRGFFDSVEHDLLLAGLSKHLGAQHPVLALVSKWLDGTVWDGERLLRVRKGLPQGSPLSPILSNFFLTPFDRAFRVGPCRLIRYGDDFTIMARNAADLVGARQRAEDILGRLRLSLNVKKTSTGTFSEGFHFIGAQMEMDAIWVRFEPHRFKKPAVWCAPPMPASLLNAYGHGALHPCGDFDPAGIRLEVDEGYTEIRRALPFDKLRIPN